METQLESAEARCTLLQKQLDYMKKMLENSERDRQDTALRSLIADRQMQQTAAPLMHTSRLEELERERVKLATTQTHAEVSMFSFCFSFLVQLATTQTLAEVSMVSFSVFLSLSSWQQHRLTLRLA